MASYPHNYGRFEDSHYYNVNGENVNVETLRNVEVNEVTPVENYWCETTQGFEVLQIESDISIAQNDDDEVAIEIGVISERPEEPIKEKYLKRIRNKIAGFTTHLMKRIQRGPVRGISLKLQEKEHECRMDFVPAESAIKTDLIEVDRETLDMLAALGMADMPGVVVNFSCLRSSLPNPHRFPRHRSPSPKPGRGRLAAQDRSSSREKCRDESEREEEDDRGWVQPPAVGERRPGRGRGNQLGVRERRPGGELVGVGERRPGGRQPVGEVWEHESG
ncbi:hypothetical protein Scep_002366 [Stephania cephalantha]|uniref:Uncharacterized protein n=1 Tax=Stephania cephalantha TaxID=152367 RepID=A0AAP0LCK7_9MAGN